MLPDLSAGANQCSVNISFAIAEPVRGIDLRSVAAFAPGLWEILQVRGQQTW